MKSDEKSFFCQIYAIFKEKLMHVVTDRYFSLHLKVLMIFLNPRLSLIVTLNCFEAIIDGVTGDVNTRQGAARCVRIITISIVLCPTVCVRITFCSGPVLLKLPQHFV